jgi:hypothetical protein
MFGDSREAMFELAIVLIGLNPLRLSQNAFYPLQGDSPFSEHIFGMLG